MGWIYFRSVVFREDLIKGQKLTLGLEGFYRIATRGEEMGVEITSTRRERGHKQRHGGRIRWHRQALHTLTS